MPYFNFWVLQAYFWGSRGKRYTLNDTTTNLGSKIYSGSKIIDNYSARYGSVPKT